jgi:uncharacterized protein YoxC
MRIEEIRTELEEAIQRINSLEEQLAAANDSIADLSQCVKNIALATQSLSSEIMCVSEIIQQAAQQSNKENDYFSWRTNPDDEGYLN